MQLHSDTKAVGKWLEFTRVLDGKHRYSWPVWSSGESKGAPTRYMVSSNSTNTSHLSENVLVLPCVLPAWASPGGGMVGRVPLVQNSGGMAHRNHDFLRKYSEYIYHFFRFFSISKMKWANSRINQNLGVGGFDSPESVPPRRNPSPPQSKLRGNIPDFGY